jgi:hypothetical protein
MITHCSSDALIEKRCGREEERRGHARVGGVRV